MTYRYLNVYIVRGGPTHACTNHYKYSAMMSMQSRDNVQAKALALVVICAHISNLLWYRVVC